jgi:hypothetical protein
MMAKEPELGFYYHYKHDPAVDINNYAYEVMGIGHHTEIKGLEESAMVMYRPLYDASVYKIGKHWDLRPLTMFTEDVILGRKIVPRFKKIQDKKILTELAAIRNKMYA